MERYKINIEVLSPIHIGCDEFFKPVEFLIDSKERVLITFSLFDLLEELSPSEKNELERIADKREVSSLVDLYKFYAYHIKDKIKSLRNIKKYSIPNELAKRYEEVLRLDSERDIIQNFNAFEIPRTYFNPYTDQPIIPGSSLKGALRTGYLEKLLREHSDAPKIKELKSKIDKVNIKTPSK
ncbi:type III-A CRISPR-associated RAMP protein Csm5, partial [Candidatus Pacearchaeota archaeon]